MINIGQFLTPYPEPNEAAGVNAAIAGLGQLGAGNIARTGMAQQQKQFEDAQRQQSEQFGQTAWANMTTNRLAQAMPLLQKHADLVAEGTDQSLIAARELESALGELGYQFRPHDAGNAIGNTAQPNAGESFHEFYGRMMGSNPGNPQIAQPNAGESFQSFYGRMSQAAPANIPGAAPPGTSSQPRTYGAGNAPQAEPPKRDRILYGAGPTIQLQSPNAVQPTTTGAPAETAKGKKEKALENLEQFARMLNPSEPTTEMPEEIRSAAKEENARNYGPMFRSAPAMLPSPGSQPSDEELLQQAQALAGRQQPVPQPIGMNTGPFPATREPVGISRGIPQAELLGNKGPMASAAPAGAKSPVGKKGAKPPVVMPPGEGLAVPASSLPQGYGEGRAIPASALGQRGEPIPAHLQPSDIYDYTGRKIGESHPERAYQASMDEAKRNAMAYVAGTDKEFRGLVEGLVSAAKSPAEIHRLMTVLGSPEVMHLINERAMRAAAFAKSQPSGRANTLDYMSGVTLFEKTLTDQSLKDYTSSYRDIKQAADLLQSGNPIATQAVSRSVAKAMNGPGVLTDQDAQAPRALLPWKDKIITALNTGLYGDLPDNVKGMFQQYMVKKASYLQSAAGESYRHFVDMMRNYGPPSPESHRGAIGAAMPFFSQFGVWNPKDFGAQTAGLAPAPKGPNVSVSAKGAGATPQKLHEVLGGL